MRTAFQDGFGLRAPVRPRLNLRSQQAKGLTSVWPFFGPWMRGKGEAVEALGYRPSAMLVENASYPAGVQAIPPNIATGYLPGVAGTGRDAEGTYWNVALTDAQRPAHAGGAMMCWCWSEIGGTNPFGQNTGGYLMHFENHSNQANTEGLFIGIKQFGASDPAWGVAAIRFDTVPTNCTLDDRLSALPVQLVAHRPYHVAMTWDGTNAHLYVNGRLRQSGAHAGAFDWDQANRPLKIGRGAGGAGYSGSWWGSIWDVRVYDRCLSEAEIAAIYEPRTRWELYQGNAVPLADAAARFAGPAGAPPTAGSMLAYWSGAAWISKPLMRWTGTEWVPAVLKRRTAGETWETV
ncbi:MAG: LamG domain-containing protein [Alphaproteobacteria bacterium]|nr:LamG domain-containing protein [Alphaproteobacteria bacterium]